MNVKAVMHIHKKIYCTSQHRGELTVGFLQLKEQREVKEELVWECVISAWTVLSPQPLSASEAGLVTT